MIERALIVGYGSIGARHLRLLRAALPKADIRVLRRSDTGLSIPNASGCFDRVTTACDFAPQVAILANPAPFHLELATALAGVGTHLLVEKPLSDTLEGVDELCTLCAARGLVLQVGYNLRFLDSLQRFRADLAAGRIGPILSVRCEIGQHLPGWRPDVDYRQTVSAQRALGGGVLLELSHELDMLRWVFGRVAWVSAWTGQSKTLEIDVEDCALVHLGFAAGPVAQLGMDFFRRDTTRTCTAIGAKGTLRWDAVAATVAHFDPEIGVWAALHTSTPARDDSYRAQIEAFLQAVAAQTPSTVAAQGADGAAVMRIIAAIHASAREQNRQIRLDEAL